jgi:hypothetical protein
MPSYSVSLLLPLRLPQVTLIGASAAFSQSLGLSGGLAPLTLYYGRSFALPALLLWTLIAACFGVFLGLCFGNPLVRNSRYPWPIAQVRREETEPIVQGVVLYSSNMYVHVVSNYVNSYKDSLPVSLPL